MLLKLIAISKLAAFLSLTVFLVILTYEVVTLAPKMKETISNVNDTTGDVKDYVHEQIEIVRSPAYQKNFEHASELGDIASKTVAQIARQTIPRVNRAVDELAAVAVSLRGVGDEAKIQVKQNGDQAAVTLASLNTFIKETDTRVSKILEDGSLMLETANPKLQALLEHADNVIVDVDGRVKAFEPLQANLAGITADFNAMTTDSKNKLREILWPPAKHGWARVGQVATYLLRPIFEGARLYFQLTALPVRLTEPVPILK